MLRRQPIAQDRRRRDRDAGARSAPVEGDPARAREARLPGLRSDHPAAGPLASDCARARAGPKLLAHVLFAKYGLHLPLNRQSDVDQWKASTSTYRRCTGWAPRRQPDGRRQSSGATSLRQSASTPTTPRCGGERQDPDSGLALDLRPRRPSVCRPRYRWLLCSSSCPIRGGAHPEQHLAGYAGLMQADAYAGFGRLYEANRKGGPIN